jgi:hypothetical protein
MRSPTATQDTEWAVRQTLKRGPRLFFHAKEEAGDWPSASKPRAPGSSVLVVSILSPKNFMSNSPMSLMVAQCVLSCHE